MLSLEHHGQCQAASPIPMVKKSGKLKMFKQRLIQHLNIRFKLDNISCKYEKRSSDYGGFNEEKTEKVTECRSVSK